MPKIDLSGLGEFAYEKPFTVILTLIGALIGYSLPSGLDYLAEIDFTQIIPNPEQILFGIPFMIFIEVISTLICSLIGLVIGLLIDSVRDTGR